MVSNKKISLFSVLFVFVLIMVRPVLADNYNYGIYDGAEILTDSEKEKILEAMKPLSEYGYVVFYTCYSSSYDSSAELICRNNFGDMNATLFYIDMKQRILTVYVNGEVADMVSQAKCTTIADNVYTLAKKGQYSECAINVFDQVLRPINGKSIDAPMQLASNIFLAVIISLLVNYLLIKLLHGNRKQNNVKLVEASGNYVWFKDADSKLVHSSRKYSPRSKSHGHGFGGGGGGFGGGGHGGSHRF